ncbi:MAG: hemerythrin domain-containing protein [Actinobacteria bacterium]|nr:hemerythrin domain-containing protein [Actinomycetota bacterium]
MDSETLGAAMEREHHEIDRGVEAFGSGGDDAVAALTAAIAALRRHIYLEEEFLFPPMQDELAIPIGVMLREHGELWRTLEALEAQLAEAGDEGEARSICERLLAQLELHNSKEEPIFYTRADASLGPAATAELKAFLDSGQMPAGWACRQA